MTPSLILVNARISTGDPRRPWVTALAIQDDTLAALGSSAEIQKVALPSTRIVDGGGRVIVLPAEVGVGSLVHVVMGQDGDVTIHRGERRE